MGAVRYSCPIRLVPTYILPAKDGCPIRLVPTYILPAKDTGPIRLVPTYILPAKEIRPFGKLCPIELKQTDRLVCVETDGQTDMARSTCLVMLIKNIYALCGHNTLCKGIKMLHQN